MLGLNNTSLFVSRVLLAELGEGVGDCRDVAVTRKGVLSGSLAKNYVGENHVPFGRK